MLMEPLLILFLVILLLVVGAGALISLILRMLFPPRPFAAQVATPKLHPELAYQPRPRVLNASEQALLEGLEQVLSSEDYRVLMQVPLSRLVAPDSTEGNGQGRDEAGLQRYRLDAVICRASDSRPRCALVFEASVCAREPAVARILSSAGLGLISVPVQAGYPREQLEAALSGRVNLSRPESTESTPAPSSGPAEDASRPENVAAPERPEPEPETDEQTADTSAPLSADGTPLCPRCYAPMERLTGEQSGWRCSRYPRCTTEVPAHSTRRQDAL